MKNDLQLEQAIQAKGLTAPRVTLVDLKANIVHTEIVKHVSHSGQVLRWAVLTTRRAFLLSAKPWLWRQSHRADLRHCHHGQAWLEFAALGREPQRRSPAFASSAGRAPRLASLHQTLSKLDLNTIKKRAAQAGFTA